MPSSPPSSPSSATRKRPYDGDESPIVSKRREVFVGVVIPVYHGTDRSNYIRFTDEDDQESLLSDSASDTQTNPTLPTQTPSAPTSIAPLLELEDQHSENVVVATPPAHIPLQRSRSPFSAPVTAPSDDLEVMGAEELQAILEEEQRREEEELRREIRAIRVSDQSSCLHAMLIIFIGSPRKITSVWEHKGESHPPRHQGGRRCLKRLWSYRRFSS